MRYTMTDPCDECPFRIGSGFTYRQLVEHARGEFPCHKACKVEETEDRGDVFVPRSDKTPHCAGALIFLEKQDAPHQMMRIVGRLGLYDPRKLNMDAPVGTKPSDYAIRKPRRDPA